MKSSILAKALTAVLFTFCGLLGWGAGKVSHEFGYQEGLKSKCPPATSSTCGSSSNSRQCKLATFEGVRNE